MGLLDEFRSIKEGESEKAELIYATPLSGSMTPMI